jgi:hypothetical protein
VLFERARGFWGGPRVPLSIAHPAPEAGSAAGAHPHESSERTQGVRAGSRGRPLPLARGTSCGVRDISWFEVMQASRPKVSRCEELSWGDLNDIPDRHPSFWMPARWRPETTRPCGMLRWRRRGCSQTPPWSSGRPPPGSVTGGDVSKLQVRSGRTNAPPHRFPAHCREAGGMRSFLVVAATPGFIAHGRVPHRAPLHFLLRYASISRAAGASLSFGASCRKRSRWVLASAVAPKLTSVRPR